MRVRGFFSSDSRRVQRPPIACSKALCDALTILSQIFGQTWHFVVVGELNRLLADGGSHDTGLTHIMTSLLGQAGKSRPGLESCFLITRSQIRYRSKDRRYTVVIIQGEPGEVLMTWQMADRRAGVSFITYRIGPEGWRTTDWEVAPECREDLARLAQAGGEVLGFLGEHGLLPEGSLFVQALERHIAHTALVRDEMATLNQTGAIPEVRDA